MIEEKKWVRYRHKSNRAIEYDVACYSITQGGPISTEFHGERCFRIRTVRNISLSEEVHRPAFTWMPADEFLEIYEVAVELIEEEKPKKSRGRPISTPIANGEGEKPCTNCGEAKPLSEFPKNAVARDGYRSECKTCFNQRRRAEPEGEKASERLCANGEKCAGFRNLGRPAPLTISNKGQICFACEERGRG